MIPPKGVYLPIPKLHSILAVQNLLAHKDTTISYVQVNSLRLKSGVATKWESKHLWVFTNGHENSLIYFQTGFYDE